MVVGKNLSDSLPPALWAVGAGGTGVLEVQTPLTEKMGPNTRQVQI